MEADPLSTTSSDRLNEPGEHHKAALSSHWGPKGT